MLEITLSESRDIAVHSTEPTVLAELKWSPGMAVLKAHAALRHRDVVGKVQHLQGRFGLSISQPIWSKMTVAVRRKLVVEKIQRYEEAARCARVVSHSKQGKKLSCRDVWGIETGRIRFISPKF